MITSWSDMQEVLDTNEACQYLRIARVTLYKYVRTGQIPATKFGSIWRFQKSALDKWMSERIHNDTSQRAKQQRGSRG
jgi:excisionase family DNA binding protein